MLLDGLYEKRLNSQNLTDNGGIAFELSAVIFPLFLYIFRWCLKFKPLYEMSNI